MYSNLVECSMLGSTQHVPRAYLLSCLDPSLSPHLHNLGVCVNGKDGVAIALVVHERTHRVDHDHRTFLIDLTEAHTIASLESTIERRRNWEVELVQFLKIFFKKNINCISPVASKIYFNIIKKYLK